MCGQGTSVLTLENDKIMQVLHLQIFGLKVFGFQISSDCLIRSRDQRELMKAKQAHNVLSGVGLVETVLYI